MTYLFIIKVTQPCSSRAFVKLTLVPALRIKSLVIKAGVLCPTFPKTTTDPSFEHNEELERMCLSKVNLVSNIMPRI